jgi:hypothetical protein
MKAQKGDGWRNFPRIILKAITANTYFFTRMIEMTQYKQIRKENRNLTVLAQIVYQIVKIGIQRMNGGENVPSKFYYEGEIPKYVFSVQIMNNKKL